MPSVSPTMSTSETPPPQTTTTTSTPSSPPSLPQPSAHVVLFLIDGIGDVPCRAFEHDRRGSDGGANSDYCKGSSKCNNLTPLEAAAPLAALDAVASCGLLGLLDPVEPGKACGSDTAHLSLLGYDPRTYYRGRGAFESLGAGLSMEPGDIAFKCNFATVVVEEEGEEGEGGGKKAKVDPTPLVASRRADRRFEEEGPALCSALDGIRLPSFPSVSVRVKYATEHRAGVVLSIKGKEQKQEAEEERRRRCSDGGVKEEEKEKRDREKTLLPPRFELSDAVSGTDPLRDNLPLLRCRSLLEESEEEEIEEEKGGKENGSVVVDDDDVEVENARLTSEIVNELSDEIRRVLSSHPINKERRRQGKPVANALLLRGCGARAPLPDFARKFGFGGGGKGEGDEGGALAVAPTKIIAGLALCAGFHVLEVEKATGDYRTSLRAKVEAVARAIEGADEEEERRERGNAAAAAAADAADDDTGNGNDGPSRRPRPPPTGPSFVLLHFKAVDDAGHDRAPFKKVAWLRAADEALALLARRLGGSGRRSDSSSSSTPSTTELKRRSRRRRRRSVVVAVTGDHSTPVEFGDHSCEPVPFAVAPLDAVARALTPSKRTDAAAADGAAREIVAASEEEMRGHVFSSPSSLPKNKNKNAATFDEISAARGALGRFPGSEVMPLLVRLSSAL